MPCHMQRERHVQADCSRRLFLLQGAHYFFDPPHINMQGHVVNFNAAETKSLTDRCASWHVPYGTVEDELRRQNVSTHDLELRMARPCGLTRPLA